MPTDTIIAQIFCCFKNRKYKGLSHFATMYYSLSYTQPSYFSTPSDRTTSQFTIPINFMSKFKHCIIIINLIAPTIESKTMWFSLTLKD